MKMSPTPIDRLSRVESNLWLLDVMPRRIYVAASLNNQENAMRLALQLQDAGFIVTSRWLRHDFSSKPGEDDWARFKELEIEMCETNIGDLAASDTLIVLADVESSSGGYHVELGFFLGRCTFQRANIIVVGKRKNVFFWEKDVRFSASTYGLVEWLVENRECGAMAQPGADAPAAPMDDLPLPQGYVANILVDVTTSQDPNDMPFSDA